MKRMPFSKWSVLGILAGRKSQTRRVMKPQPPDDWAPGKCLIADNVGEGFTFYGTWAHEGHEERGVFRQRYQAGEVVAMGEGLMAKADCGCDPPCNGLVTYCADSVLCERPTLRIPSVWRWKARTLPSIFMPEWAARRWLRITDVRAERAEDISEEDALAEGLVHSLTGNWRASNGNWSSNHIGAWLMTLHDHNPKMEPGDNPWLWAYSLEQVDKPKGEGDV